MPLPANENDDVRNANTSGTVSSPDSECSTPFHQTSESPIGNEALSSAASSPELNDAVPLLFACTQDDAFVPMPCDFTESFDDGYVFQTRWPKLINEDDEYLGVPSKRISDPTPYLLPPRTPSPPLGWNSSSSIYYGTPYPYTPYTGVPAPGITAFPGAPAVPSGFPSYTPRAITPNPYGNPSSGFPSYTARAITPNPYGNPSPGFPSYTPQAITPTSYGNLPPFGTGPTAYPPLWFPPEPRNEMVPPPAPATAIYSSAYNPWTPAPGPVPNPNIACPPAYGYGLGANRASTYPYRAYTPVPVAPYPGDYTYGNGLKNSPPHGSDDSYTPAVEEKKNWTLTPLIQPYWDDEDSAPYFDPGLGVDLLISKRRKLVKETRKRWLKDLFKAVFGYGLISLGIVMFFFGLLYLYDADMQYRHVVERMNETVSEFGCNSTVLGFANPDLTTAPQTPWALLDCLDVLSFDMDFETSHIYKTAAYPYLYIISILVSYTMVVLSIAVWRTSGKIVECVKEGNAFVERYLSIRKGYTTPSCRCYYCPETSMVSQLSRCNCIKGCIDCQQARANFRFQDRLQTKSLRPSADILAVFETLKPTTWEEWAQKVSWMMFTLHLPMAFLISIVIPILLKGPTLGSYLDYTWVVFMALACVGCIVKFTRQILSPKVKTFQNDAEYIEGAGMSSTETRVSVPWISANMWHEIGADWEDMVYVWRECVREDQRIAEEEAIRRKYHDDVNECVKETENEKMYRRDPSRLV